MRQWLTLGLAFGLGLVFADAASAQIKLGVGSPFGALSAELYRQLCALGPEQINESKIIEVAQAQPPARD